MPHGSSRPLRAPRSPARGPREQLTGRRSLPAQAAHRAVKHLRGRPGLEGGATRRAAAEPEEGEEEDAEERRSRLSTAPARLAPAPPPF